MGKLVFLDDSDWTKFPCAARLEKSGGLRVEELSLLFSLVFRV